MSMRAFASLALVLAVLGGPALAEKDERVPPVTHGPTLEECGECHMAFQPALLPAASWRRIMGNLSDHFGEDAGLDPASAAGIERYLVGGAGRGDPSLDRVTEQPWFRRKHDFADRVWQRPDVRSKANCAACHRDAERGWYEGE